MREQLCWDCQRAIGGYGCSWADGFKPVKGWERKCVGRKTFVVNCPLFVADCEEKLNPSDYAYDMSLLETYRREINPQKEVVVQYSLDGERLDIFKNVTRAAKNLRISVDKAQRMLKVQYAKDEYLLRKENAL